jgi:hypothetical protein
MSAKDAGQVNEQMARRDARRFGTSAMLLLQSRRYACSPLAF